MKFHVVNYKSKDNAEKQFPCITLVQDTWDDYGHKTLFTAWFNHSSEDKSRIGQVKIISKETGSYDDRGYVVLDSEFTHLSDEFCTLGQDTDYYHAVRKHFKSDYKELLGPLNDGVVNIGILDDFEDEGDFKSSLIRFSEAERAFKLGLSILIDQDHREDYKFNFSCRVGKAMNDHSATFTFCKSSIIPSRIMSIVGGNGSGKTQYLAKLALAISGEKKQGEFTPSRPLFNKVIAVSYSAFDKFDRPVKKRSFSYKYCGIKDSSGFLNAKKLENNYKSSCDRIEKKKREIVWHSVLNNIINNDVLDNIYEELFEKRNFSKVAHNTDGLLSSGQSVLMYVVTEILANIREDSLVLFDEPEMHLHPNAISKLVTMLNQILERFDSYAVLATHSPIILQEMPSKNVLVFERDGDIATVGSLSIESFGENITTITKHAFETVNTEPNYKVVLKNLSQTKTFDEVSMLFGGRLSLNSEIYLKSCYKNEEP